MNAIGARSRGPRFGRRWGTVFRDLTVADRVSHDARTSDMRRAFLQGGGLGARWPVQHGSSVSWTRMTVVEKFRGLNLADCPPTPQ